MKRASIFVLLLLFIIAPLRARAEESIEKGETLDLRRCIEIALARHPNILAATSTVRANESRVGQAKSNYYPQIAWSSGYGRIYGSSSGTGSLSQGGAFDDYASRLILSQNIYDFGKTSDHVSIQNLNTASSRQDLENITSQIVFTTKQAYFDLIRSTKNREVAVETVRQSLEHLAQAKGFFAVGTRPKFDVTKAEVDVSRAKLILLTTENNIKIARVNLNNAMGIPEAPEYAIEDNLSYEPYEIALHDALKKAYEHRPDLKSVLLQKGSLKKSIDLAKTGYYPSLTGTADYGYEGRDFPLNEGWTVGAQLNVPIFNGGLTRYQVREARENFDVLKANEEALRQSISLEVQQACLNLQLAKDQITTTELAVRQANENLDLANGRYAAGVGNPIEVTDSLVAQGNAKMAYVEALYNYKVAQASIEKAMGMVR